MSEITQIKRVVEARSTFIPSDRFRDKLANLLNPNLDKQTRESLKAAFLLYSWRRRIIDLEDYHLHERNRGGDVDAAMHRFIDLPKVPIRLDFGVSGERDIPREKARRIVFGLRSDGVGQLESVNDILSEVPSIEDEPEIEKSSRLIYLQVLSRNLGSVAMTKFVRSELRDEFIHPSTTRLNSVTPHQIIVREIMVPDYSGSIRTDTTGDDALATPDQK